jgi:hypothetical protein
MLGEGASGKVYAIAGAPGTAAKLYHTTEEARRYETKIEAMLNNPPVLPPAAHDGADYPQIAWPQAKLHDPAGNFIGFLMPEVDFARSASLVNLLQKSSRRLEGISEYYGYRVLVARNLASIFAELHRAGHHMIDLKPANLRFYPAMSWMAVVDADGFSIAGANGRIAANQLSDEYIAPESWNRKPAELGLAQDLFALAAIIFQLLNNGVHPFAGTAAGSAATDLQARIREGLYPYAIEPRPGVTPSKASVHRMFRRATRAMFDAAFLTARRPAAAEWRDHLDLLLAQLTPCSSRPGEHMHFGAGCGFCGHEARMEAVRTQPRRIRPHPPAVRSRPRAASPLPLPLPRTIPRFTHAPARARPRVGFILRSSALAAVVATLAIGSGGIWQQLQARRAPAETLAVLSTRFANESTPFSSPREYMVLPHADGRPIPLREGPGSGYASQVSVGAEDLLTGSATATSHDGVIWVMVTRADGETGFVPQERIIESDAVVTAIACPEGKTCEDGMIAAHEGALGERFRNLLARAAPKQRAGLEAGQRAWQAHRLACGDTSLPLDCRIRLAVERWGALDDYLVKRGG